MLIHIKYYKYASADLYAVDPTRAVDEVQRRIKAT